MECIFCYFLPLIRYNKIEKFIYLLINFYLMKYVAYGIGSPLIDIVIKIEEEILAKLKLKKGRMHLLTSKQIKEILDAVENSTVKISPGDSTANTIVGIANLGGKAAYLGKLGKDEHASFFNEDLKKNKVDSKTTQSGNFTGKVIALISPDSERTMAVHLGAALDLKPEDINEEDIKNSEFLHITGYQLEDKNLKETLIKAMNIAKTNNIKISVDLADAELIKRNLEFLKSVVKDYADVVFANEEEAKAFTGKEGKEALHILSETAEIAIIKLGEKGSLIKAEGKIHEIPAYKTEAVDTTGAGDMYAAGFLFGLSKKYGHEKCGKIGSFAASRVVSQHGARLDYSLKEHIINL